MSDPTPAGGGRVRVTGPRTHRPRRASVAAEIDAQTELGAVYMRSLIRSQLRLGLGVLLVVATVFGGIPLAFQAFPALVSVHVAGVPLPWLVLGVGVYPVLIGLAIVYVRRAERNERAFNELLRPR